MSIDAESIRRMIREDREEAERKAADKQERADLLARLEKLESRKREEPDHEAEPDGDDDDHPFEV